MGPQEFASAGGVERTPLPLRAASGWAWLERESLVVVVVAVYTTGLLLRLPRALVSDSWLTLVYGREFWRHGLPRTGDLTVWAHGLGWVDQQWLAQAFFGGLAGIGGVRSALVVHALLLIAAFGLAIVASRRLGGSVRSVPLVALLALPVLSIDWVLRAQSIAYLFFVLLVWLVVADSRVPSRRVYLALPLLVVWANVHGSVLLAAGLVALRGLTLVRTNARRGTVLTVAPWVCVFASPYGPAGLIHYYRSLLVNPLLSTVVPEWGRTTPSLQSLGFYLLAFVTVWLLGRSRHAAGLFERLALLLLLADGLLAIRNMVWFCLAAVVIVPSLVDERLSGRATNDAPRLIRVALPLAATAAAAIALGVGVHRAGSYNAEYPSAAAAAVARAAAAHPGLPVFAETQYADWLMWQQPGLRGRVAYDARFELLHRRQLANLYFWSNHIGKHWEAIPGCSAIIVVNRRQEPLTERALLATRHATRVFEDAQIAVLVSRQPVVSCKAGSF